VQGTPGDLSAGDEVDPVPGLGGAHQVERPGRMSQDVTATVGEPVTVQLPAEVYSIKATDGKTCMTGVRVSAGATISDALVLPYSGCEDASGFDTLIWPHPAGLMWPQVRHAGA
jgi:hypothetical protein